MNIVINDKKKNEIFTSIFHLLKNCATEINATFMQDALHIQGMDKTHICLFDLNLKKEWFCNYEVSENIQLCFNANLFYSIITTKCNDQQLVIKKSDDSLMIELVNGDKIKDYNKYFTMPLIDYEYEELHIPETDYDAEISLPSKKLTDILSQLNNFGDDLNVICSEDCVDFKVNGTLEMRVNIPVDDMSSYSIIEGEIIDLTYSLAYINNKMCITNKLSSDVDLCLSQECPMKIKYDLGEESLLLFYVAPKISN